MTKKKRERKERRRRARGRAKKPYEYEGVDAWLEDHPREAQAAVIRFFEERGGVMNEKEIQDAFSHWWMNEIFYPSMVRLGLPEPEGDVVSQEEGIRAMFLVKRAKEMVPDLRGEAVGETSVGDAVGVVLEHLIELEKEGLLRIFFDSENVNALLVAPDDLVDRFESEARGTPHDEAVRAAAISNLRSYLEGRKARYET